MAADGTVAELIGGAGDGDTARAKGRRHTVVTRKGHIDAVIRAVEKIPDVGGTERGPDLKGGEVELVVFPKKDQDLRAEIARVVVEAGAPLLGLRHAEVNLEDVFRGLTMGEGKKRKVRGRKKDEPEPAEEVEEDEVDEEAEDSDEEAEDSDDDETKEKEA
jgi:hypothetical protein